MCGDNFRRGSHCHQFNHGIRVCAFSIAQNLERSNGVEFIEAVKD